MSARTRRLAVATRAIGTLLPVVPLSCALQACSFGLFQTAHTQPPKTVSATLGITQVTNEIDGEEGRGGLINTALQAGVRVGLSPRVDLGVGTFFLSGARADVKVNLLDPTGALAVAPRVGLGGQIAYEVFMAELGGIVSYRFGYAEPYFGLTFANHWIDGYPPPYQRPQNLAPATGAGNGLLQGAIGMALDTNRGVSFMAEYGHWFVLNNDPADFYSFVPTNIFGLAIRIGGHAPPPKRQAWPPKSSPMQSEP